MNARNARIWLMLAILVAGGAFWAYRYATRPPPLAERDEVLLADFTNTTGDAVFDGVADQVDEDAPQRRLVAGDVWQTVIDRQLDERA